MPSLHKTQYYATELFASEWTAVTIGELHLTASNLNKSIWRHSQIQTLHSDFKAKPDSVLTSGLYQWTLTQSSGLKFALEILSVCPVCIKPNTLSSAIDFTALTLHCAS
jgi:hypothetical protein